MKKRVLITGGAGFIGTNFVRFLYERYPDVKIWVLDALTYAGSVANLPHEGLDTERVVFWHGDVLNSSLVDHLVSQVDYVFHFAAETHVTRSIFDNRHFFETDVIGTQTVCNSVLKYRDTITLFVHISTSEVYGSAITPKMNETHPLAPMSPYAAAKCGADRLVYSYWKTYELPALIVRPFNNYGPYQHLEKVIPRFITSCILNEPLTVHGQGEACRDFIHVHDHCVALERMLALPAEQLIGKVVNLGSGVDRSILEIAETIKKLMGSHSPIELLGERPGQVVRHTCDASLALALLDWKPDIEFKEGLEESITWYQQNQSLWASQRWLRHIPIVTASGKREYH